MIFKKITDQQVWKSYILSRKEANFLQSWHWANFQQKIGKTIFAIGIFDKKKQIGSALLVKEEAKRGNYLTIAGGPLINWQELNISELTEIFNFFKQLAKKNNCSFVRFRPQALNTNFLQKKLAKLAAKKAPMHLTADLTLQINLFPTEEELLKKMRKNTRYEIRKSQKLGIEIRTSQDPAQIKRFYEDQLILAKKHNFVPFSYEFLFEQFKKFAANDNAMLFDAYYQGKLLASAFIIFYNNEAVYHYGTSTLNNQRLPGSYACQWAAILEAKKRGCAKYNLWGIAPTDQVNHRFAGVSLFKRGFGGEEVAYLPAHDLPVSNNYWIIRIFEWMRRKARRL